ncbi:hypothetical protein Tco_1311006 [Tanacetum coccineum]
MANSTRMSNGQSDIKIQDYFKDKMPTNARAQENGASTLLDEEQGSLSCEPSYDSNTPFEVQDHDTFVNHMDEYHKYVEDNEEHVVQSNVSSVRDDALISILDEMHEQGVQSRLANKPNMVVKDSVTSELARYKELVGEYEKRAKFELTDRERKIDEQMRIIISDRNRKETSLKSELHSAQILLNSTVGHYKSKTEEVTILKKDFKQKEDKFLEEFLDIKRLKEKVEDRLYKQDQSVQTVHMLCKPKSFYDEKNKVAIGYKNPLCLTRAKQVQPALYNGHVLVMSNHARPVVHDSEDTREIAEITRKRMLLKMQSPLSPRNIRSRKRHKIRDLKVLVANVNDRSCVLAPTDKEMEMLFQPMFDEYLEQSRVNDPVPSATEINAQVVPPGTSLSTTIAQDAPSTSASSSTFDMHHPVLHQEITEEPTHEDSPINHDVLHPSHNPVTGEPGSAQSSFGNVNSAEPNQRTESETEAAAPKGDKYQGEVDSSRVTSGVSIPVSTQVQAGSDPEKAHEALAGPDPEPMQEDQTGSNSGKAHVSLAGPNSEHMDDEFLATAYPKVHENLKLITDECVIEDNPESHYGSMSSMKNLDDTDNFGDQFLYDKPTEDDQEKSKVIEESDSTIPDPSHQTVTSTPPVIAPFTDVSSTKPSSLVTPPPINTEATTITTSLPEITPFIALQLRVARLEQEMSEVKKTDHSADVLASIKSQVPTVVDKYLGTKLDDALLKILERHTADLIEKYSVLPGPESIKNQESEKSPKEIIRIKREQGEEKQDSTYSIRSTDKVDLEEFDLKSALFKHMNKNKPANRNPANYHLYHALIEALITDEDAMDKEVKDRVKNHKRKHDSDDDEDDDDDEGPSAGSNQGKSSKRRRHDSGASRSAQPPIKDDKQSSKKPWESNASASKQHPAFTSTGWQITDTRDAVVVSSMHISDPKSEHSEQSSDDIPMQDEGHVSDLEDTDNAHIPKVSTTTWFKPIPEGERPATPEPEWTIPPNDFPEPENNWANTYATTYQVPAENKLQRKTYDIGSFIKWFCRRTGKKKLCKADLEGPAFNLVKAFHKNSRCGQ